MTVLVARAPRLRSLTLAILMGFCGRCVMTRGRFLLGGTVAILA